jgi:hypothetical protein
MENDETGPKGGKAGHRKNGKPFAPGNMREDGSYKVGRSRPPESGKFAPNDGRKRGRRPKGVRNFDTDFAEEAARIMPVKENGKVRKVTKQRGVIIHGFHKAVGEGNVTAIENMMQHSRRIADKSPGSAAANLTDREIVDQYLRERAAELGIEPALYGDIVPSEPISGAEGDEMPTLETDDDR